MEPVRPKVLLAITKSNWGGAQAYIFDLAVAYKARGIDVAVAAGGDGLLIERLAEEGVRTIALSEVVRDVAMLEDRHSLFNPKIIFNSVKQELRALFHFKRLLQEEAPDVLHLNSSKMGGLGAFAARLAGVKNIVFTAHGWPHKEPRAFPVKLAIWLLSWWTVALSHKVIAVSENDVSESPVFLSRRKIHLVRNGIEPFALLSPAEARKALELPKGPSVMLSIAELHHNKGIDAAITAFAEFSAAHSGWVFAVIGEGEKRKELEFLIDYYDLKEKVLLLGFKPEARKYLKVADVFLLPSRKEGLPITLLEAGFASVPTIASRTGGIPEVVQHKETGLLAPPNNPHGLARMMRLMAEEPLPARRYAEALHKRVKDKFSKERMIEETLATYGN